MALDPVAAVQRLNNLLSQLASIKSQFDPQLSTWREEVLLVLWKAYGSDSEESARFKAISFSGYADTAFQDGAMKATLFLRSRIDELTPVTIVAANPSLSATHLSGSNRKVFIVHGHNHGMKETVARFLTKLDLEPIILHEQSEQGSTIIEKFEENANVAFA